MDGSERSSEGCDSHEDRQVCSLIALSGDIENKYRAKTIDRFGQRIICPLPVLKGETVEITEIILQATDSGVIIPKAVLEEMEIHSGESVYVVYFSKDKINEFLIMPHSIADAEQKLRIQIPTELLSKAQIDEDSDIAAACLNGAILLVSENSLNSEDLNRLLESLQICNGILENVPENTEEAIIELKSLVNDLDHYVEDNYG